MQNILTDKKGQVVGNSVGAILTLVIGIGISIFVLIFAGALGGQTFELVEDDITLTGSVTNESITLNNATAVSLANNMVRSLTITNSTANIELGNFTIDWSAGTILLTGDHNLNGTPANASYQHGNLTIENAIRGSIISGFDALETSGNYLPIIVLAVVIAIVLAMVMGFGSMGGLSMGGRGAL